MYVRVGKQKPEAFVPAIKTVVMEPDQDRLALLWVREAPLDLPFTPADRETLQHAVTWS